jgi:hypothetical protein
MTTRITFRVDPAPGKRVVLKYSNGTREYDIEPGIDYSDHVWSEQSIELIERDVELERS